MSEPVRPTAEPGAPTRGTGRFVAGDPLRGFWALAVLVVHAAVIVIVAHLTEHPSWSDVWGTGPGRLLFDLNLGLHVFFVLSGYLITLPFVRAFVHARTLPSMNRYLLRRALRILPAFWVAVAVLSLLHGTKGSSPGDYFWLLTLQQTGHPSGASGSLVPQAWSLDLEALFYLAVPLTAWLLARAAMRLGPAGRLRLAWGVLGAVFALSVVLHATGSERSTYPSTFEGMLALFYAFVPGIALALAEVTNGPRLSSLPRFRQAPYALLGLSAAGFLGYSIAVDPSSTSSVAPSSAPVFAAISTGALVAAPLVLQWSGRGTWRWLDNRVLHWYGERSYSFYLFHVGVLLLLDDWVFDHLGGPRWELLVLVALAIPLNTVFAHLGFTYVEKPFMQMAGSRRPASKDAITT